MVQCMNVLDVLVSLTVYTMTSEGVMCKPEIIPPKSDTKVCWEHSLSFLLVEVPSLDCAGDTYASQKKHRSRRYIGYFNVIPTLQYSIRIPGNTPVILCML